MLSLLLLIIFLEALSREIRSRCLKKCSAGDLALVSETSEGLKGRLEAMKGALESKTLRVNVKKTKMMISNTNEEKGTVEGKFPCAVRRKSVRSNLIIFSFPGVVCMRDIMILEIKKAGSLNVSHVQIIRHSRELSRYRITLNSWNYGEALLIWKHKRNWRVCLWQCYNKD